jgi:hypothetical protein
VDSPCKPPHGPVAAGATLGTAPLWAKPPRKGPTRSDGSYTLRCLACGVKGPEREDTLRAKLAFEETFVANDCYSPTFREVEFSEVHIRDTG